MFSAFLEVRSPNCKLLIWGWVAGDSAKNGRNGARNGFGGGFGSDFGVFVPDCETGAILWGFLRVWWRGRGVGLVPEK